MRGGCGGRSCAAGQANTPAFSPDHTGSCTFALDHSEYCIHTLVKQRSAVNQRIHRKQYGMLYMESMWVPSTSLPHVCWQHCWLPRCTNRMMSSRAKTKQQRTVQWGKLLCYVCARSHVLKV
jgi:hypothetical protein